MTEIATQVPPLEVRQADEVTDTDQTAALGSAAFRETHAEILETAVVEAIVSQIYSEESIHRSIRACREARTAYFLVAHRGDSLVGFLEYDEHGDEPELHRLYVSARSEGQRDRECPASCLARAPALGRPLPGNRFGQEHAGVALLQTPRLPRNRSRNSVLPRRRPSHRGSARRGRFPRRTCPADKQTAITHGSK